MEVVVQKDEEVRVVELKKQMRALRFVVWERLKTLEAYNIPVREARCMTVRGA